MANNVFTFENDLAYDVVTYTSINNPTDTSEDYLGELTELGVVTANTKKALNTNSDEVAYVFVVEAASDNKPLARYKKTGLDGVTGYTVSQKDEDAMNNTLKFIQFKLDNPNDTNVQKFDTIMRETSISLSKDVDAFFQTLPGYQNCTFALYSMGILYASKNPTTVVDDNGGPTYSLSTLIKLLGGKWPSGMQDITATECSIASKDGVIVISATILFESITFETSQVGDNVRRVLGVDTHIKVGISVSTQIGLGIGSTRLSLQFDDFAIPVTGSDKIKVKAAEATLDINPLFKFLVFTLSGTIPFNINSEAVDIGVSLTIDNDELSAGAVIYAEKGSLLTLPGLKGVHIDEFGLGVGVFFKPPACAIGVEGKFHIGEPATNNVISLDDDTLAIVAKVTGEEIHPEYMAFNIPQLGLDQVMEIFTDTKPSFGLPIQFSNLSVRWVASFMDGVILPDGSVSPMGYAFSAAASIYSFGFYGDVSVDLDNFVTANLEVSPINWKNLFQLTGDGKGYSIKIDKNGNPIPAHFIPYTQAEKDAVDNATEKPLVSPGGPVLVVNTLKAPILHLNAKASLFDVASYEVQADINKSGITFLLDYGVVLKEKMTVTLSDWHNLAASFTYYINQTITVPPVAGMRLGSFTLAADVAVHFAIATSLTDVKLGVGGGFDFWSLHRTFGDFEADINITRITDFLKAIGDYIEQNARQIFSNVLGDAQKWAEYVKSGFLTGCDEIGGVIKNVWHGDSIAVASIMKEAGYAIDDISRNIKDAWNCTANDVTYALKAVGYTASEVAKSLKNVFNAASQDVAAALKAMGFTAQQVGQAIKDAWDCGINDVAWAMDFVHYSLDDIAATLKAVFGAGAQDVANALALLSHTIGDICKALRDVFNIASQDLAGVLKTIEYSAQEVAGAIRDAWNCGINDVTWAMQQAGYAVSDIAEGLKSAFNAAAQDVASAFKTFGIEAQDAVTAMVNVYNLAIKDAASVLKQAGYAAKDVASALKNAYNTTAEAVADAMKQAGYAVNDVKNAFDELGGDFKSFADTAWSDTKYYLNPSHW